MSLTAIILAAGKSTRMKSKRPKPLHEVCGKPMLEWILDACFSADVTRALVVVGQGKDEIIERFGKDRRIQFVEQTEQLGTGHAARMCEPLLRGHGGDVLLLAGDTPLIRGEILRTLLQAHHDDRIRAGDPRCQGRFCGDCGAGGLQ
jgi:bifunctional UDP-N-acetylglucosamine pyrophosphorylase/glucosamine-1-phosphate N-acetyltransferase